MDQPPVLDLSFNGNATPWAVCYNTSINNDAFQIVNRGQNFCFHGLGPVGVMSPKKSIGSHPKKRK